MFSFDHSFGLMTKGLIDKYHKIKSMVTEDTLEGRIQDFWKGGSSVSRFSMEIFIGLSTCMYTGMGIRFADFISFFLNIP